MFRLNHKGNVGVSARPSSQDGVPQQQEAAPLFLPQLNLLYEVSFARDENSPSGDTGVAAIPSQFKITQQILKNWQPFRDFKIQFVGSRRQEQLSSRCQQRVVATVEESVLRTEMAGLESQEEDAPQRPAQRVLFYKPMTWVGQIRPHRRDESWSASLWQTFFSTSMGDQIPMIPEKPLAVCGCRKFKIDALAIICVLVHLILGLRRLTTGWLINSLTFFVRPTKSRHNRWLRTGDSNVAILN